MFEFAWFTCGAISCFFVMILSDVLFGKRPTPVPEYQYKNYDYDKAAIKKMASILSFQSSDFDLGRRDIEYLFGLADNIQNPNRLKRIASSLSGFAEAWIEANEAMQKQSDD